MTIIEIDSKYITLNQFLKFSGIISNGGAAKAFLNNNDVLINNKSDKRRGRKLYHNDIIEILNVKYQIKCT
jgi:ribosome-associated protein